MAPAARTRPPVSYRGPLAALLLVVVAVCLASFQSGSEIARRWALLTRSIVSGTPAPAETLRFWFDPDYAVFLEAVAERTPAGASVAVLVPARPDAYLYLAVYRLAPRRVVDARWMGEASAVAVYRTEAGRGPEGEPIPHGTLRVR